MIPQIFDTEQKETPEPEPPKSYFNTKKYIHKTIGSIPVDLRHRHNQFENLMYSPEVIAEAIKNMHDPKVTLTDKHISANNYLNELRERLDLNDTDGPIVVLSNWNVVLLKDINLDEDIPLLLRDDHSDDML